MLMLISCGIWER